MNVAKKVLITGGAGFIGLHLAKRLNKEGFKVTIMDNFSRAVEDIELEELISNNSVNSKNIDFLNEEEVKNIGDDYSFIFHLAAIIGVNHVLNAPYNVLLDNIRMLSNVIDLSKRQKNLSRLFFASTSEVYAGTLQKFSIKIPTEEITPLALTDLDHPRTSYMLSKIYGEAMCLQSDLPVTIFRPHNLYGPRMGLSHVIPEQLKKAHFASVGDKIDVFNSSHTRAFCYIDDAVEIIIGMIRNEKCINQTLNLGTQTNEITIEDLVRLCHSIVGKDLEMEFNNQDRGSPNRRAPDMTLTTKLTGVKSKISLEQGIKRSYDWYSKNVFEGNIISAK